MGVHHALVLILKLKTAPGYQHVQFMAVGPTGDPGQRWDFAPRTVDLANSSLTGPDLVPTQNLSTKGSTAMDKLMKRSEEPAIHTIVQ